MSEQRQLLSDSATRLFEANRDAAARAQSQGWQQNLWDEIDALGIADILIAESAGGSGADWDDACAILQASGHWQIPLPLAEAMIARKLIGRRRAGGAALTAQHRCDADRYLVARRARPGNSPESFPACRGRRDVSHIITALPFDGRPHVVALAVANATVHERTNLAYEPRDDLQFEGAQVLAAPASGGEAHRLFEYAALARTAQIAGALQSALERSIAYVQERKQFGRPIGQFQAVQQQLALFGADAAAATCASRSAAIAASAGDASFQIAAAKLRANQAIGVATATAHQVHGAIGFTQEYALRHATQRLWSWRSEYGNDRYWSEQLGRTVIASGADNFWAELVNRL